MQSVGEFLKIKIRNYGFRFLKFTISSPGAELRWLGTNMLGRGQGCQRASLVLCGGPTFSIPTIEFLCGGVHRFLLQSNLTCPMFLIVDNDLGGLAALRERTTKMAKVAQKTLTTRTQKAQAKVAAVKAPKVPVVVSEAERIRVAIKMNHGMRAQILMYMIAQGPGVYTGEKLKAVPSLAWISQTNIAACLVHIAWKLQSRPCGYTLAVMGAGASVAAKLDATQEARTQARKSRKALAAPKAPEVAVEPAQEVTQATDAA